MKVQLFSETELKKIEDISLRILKEVGVELNHDDTLARFWHMKNPNLDRWQMGDAFLKTPILLIPSACRPDII